jgi:hypothetical protein
MASCTKRDLEAETPYEMAEISMTHMPNPEDIRALLIWAKHAGSNTTFGTTCHNSVLKKTRPSGGPEVKCRILWSISCNMDTLYGLIRVKSCGKS